MRHHRLTLALATLALMAGCTSLQTPASGPQDDPQAVLIRPAYRDTFPAYGDGCVAVRAKDAGMGVTVTRCTQWVFGPTRGQARAFARAHGLKVPEVFPDPVPASTSTSANTGD